MKKTTIRKGAYILPSLFTIANLFIGFSSLIFAMNGKYKYAAIAVFFAALMDMFDGRIARMTGTTSEFGAELDSIVDVVSFGVTPAFLTYNWGFSQLSAHGFPMIQRIGWAASFLFLTCGALRLARFNVQTKAHSPSKYFVGLPIPVAALFIASIVLKFPNPITNSFFAYLVFSATVFAALLMVSTIKFNSFKNVNLKNKKPYTYLVVIALFFIGLIVFPATVLFIFAVVYIIHPFVFRFGRKTEEKITEEEKTISGN